MPVVKESESREFAEKRGDVRVRSVGIYRITVCDVSGNRRLRHLAIEQFPDIESDTFENKVVLGYTVDDHQEAVIRG